MAAGLMTASGIVIAVVIVIVVLLFLADPGYPGDLVATWLNSGKLLPMSENSENEYETRRALNPETRGGDKPEDITGLPEALGPTRAPASPEEQMKRGIEYIQKTYGKSDDDGDE